MIRGKLQIEQNFLSRCVTSSTDDAFDSSARNAHCFYSKQQRPKNKAITFTDGRRLHIDSVTRFYLV